jgi:ADP-ribosylglycohydrolase
VAVAAALLCTSPEVSRERVLDDVAAHCRPGPLHDALLAARELRDVAPTTAAAVLGSGQLISALDTVPFALWCATGNADSVVDTFWATVAGLGDRDTTCAIACSVVTARLGTSAIPSDWLARVEPIDLAWG